MTGASVIAYHVKQTSHERRITANHSRLILRFKHFISSYPSATYCLRRRLRQHDHGDSTDLLQYKCCSSRYAPANNVSSTPKQEQQYLAEAAVENLCQWLRSKRRLPVLEISASRGPYEAMGSETNILLRSWRLGWLVRWFLRVQLGGRASKFRS